MRVREVLEAVGLPDPHLELYPHEISGGQQRRVGLARMLMLRPSLVILDEPTSGLDVSVQATVLQLFPELRERFALTYMFISHDLAVVRLMSQRIAVMYLGRVVELGATEQVFAEPRHPYTQSLLAAVPVVGGRRVTDDFCARGRAAEPGRLAKRLPLPAALPARAGKMRGNRAGTAPPAGRPAGGVPSAVTVATRSDDPESGCRRIRTRLMTRTERQREVGVI